MLSLSQLIYQGRTDFEDDDPLEHADGRENDVPPQQQPTITDSSRNTSKRPRPTTDNANTRRPERAKAPAGILKKRPRGEEINQRNIHFKVDQEAALNAFYFGDHEESASTDSRKEMLSLPVEKPPPAHTTDEDDYNDDDGDKPTPEKKRKRLVCPPIIVPSARLPKKPPRPKLIRRGRIPYKRNLSKAEIAKYYQTPEQQEETLRKRKLCMAHSQVREKWKGRTSNVLSEVDVGDAISTLARKVLQEERRQQKIEQRKNRSRNQQSKEADESESDNDARMHDDLIDSSDEERETALGSLLRNPPPDEPRAAASAAIATPSEPSENDALEPNEDAEDYFWQLGYAAPPKEKLQFHYLESVKFMEPPLDYDETTIKEEMFKDTLESVSTIGRWSQWSNQYFPLSRDYLSKRTFVHERHLRHMAARYIVASADDGHNKSKANMDQRLLRLLFRSSSRRASRQFLLLTQAKQAARNLELYRQTKWKHAPTVAARLGVAASQEFGNGWTDQLPIPFLSGCSMDREMVQRYNLKERRSLIKHFADYRLIEWTKESGLSSHGGCESNRNDFSDKGQTTDSDEIGVGKFSLPYGNCNYAHLPGSTPPLPNFPLDATQIIFGSLDPNSHVSHLAQLDNVTYSLTLCSLFSHWIVDLERNPHETSIWWNQIQTFIEQVPTLNSNKLYKRILRHNKRTDVDNFPLVSYYNAMMGYCSVVANMPFAVSNSPNHKHSATWDDSSETDEEGDPDEKDSCDHSIVARTIHDFCEGHIGHNSLQHFPKLRTTFGLVSVAKILPPSAAEILSRSLDDIQLRTPFDIMRLTLEHLEEERMLIEVDTGRSYVGKTKAASFVIAGEVEYALYKASKILADSVGRDPHNLENHLWYLSVLSGSLLLCSGLRIGGAARRFPSRKSSSKQVKRGDRNIEVRCKLPTYDQVRREVAEGFLRIVRLANEQNGYRSHLAVSSFLEWRQVVALLMGPANDFESIHKLHSVHVLSWAESQPQEVSHQYLAHLWELNALDPNKYISMIATKIETDPSQGHNWRKLLAALGPVGICACDEQKKECREEYCIECDRLGRELNVDHDNIKTLKCNPNWWATTRISWWLSHPLRISVPQWPTLVPYDAHDKMGKQLGACQLLPLEDLGAKVLDFKTHAQAQHCVEEEMLFWLPCKKLDGGQDEDLAPIATIHSMLALVPPDKLPTPFYEVYKAAMGREIADNLDIFAPPVSAVNKHLEALSQKVVVVCHLYSNTHESVIRAVEYLLRQCIPDEWENTSSVNQNCDAWRCLVWLTSFGLNLSKILFPRVGPPSKSRYSLAEQEAVLKGIQRFGVGKWMLIKRTGGEVLAGSSHIRVRDIYRWLLKRGKLNAGTEEAQAQSATAAATHKKKPRGIAAQKMKAKQAALAAQQQAARKETSDESEHEEEDEQQTKRLPLKKRAPKHDADDSDFVDETAKGDDTDEVKETKRPAAKKRERRKTAQNLDYAEHISADDAEDRREADTKRLPVKKRAPRKTTTDVVTAEIRAGQEAKRRPVKKRPTKQKPPPPPKKAKLDHSALENRDSTQEPVATENYDLEVDLANRPSSGSVASLGEYDNISLVAV